MRPTGAEADLCRCNLALNVENMWVSEMALVKVSCGIEHHDFFAFENLLSVDLCVLHGGATEVDDWRCNPDDFFNSCAVVSIEVLEPNLFLIRILCEQAHSVTDCVTGCFVSSNDEENEERAELLGSEAFAVDFSGHHGACDVVLWMKATVFAKFLRVRKDFHAHCQEIFIRRNELRVAHAKDDVCPMKNSLLVLFGDAHHVADHLQWKR